MIPKMKMFNLLRLGQKARQKNSLLASPSLQPFTIFPEFFGVRFQRASHRPDHHQQTQNLKDAIRQSPDESPEAGDPLKSLNKEYVSRCEDDGYGGIIYGKDIREDGGENIASDTSPATSSPGSTIEVKEESYLKIETEQAATGSGQHHKD